MSDSKRPYVETKGLQVKGSIIAKDTGGSSLGVVSNAVDSSEMIENSNSSEYLDGSGSSGDSKKHNRQKKKKSSSPTFQEQHGIPLGKKEKVSMCMFHSQLSRIFISYLTTSLSNLII